MDTIDCITKENHYSDLRRRQSILSALDSVHQSLLLNNLQFDEQNSISRLTENNLNQHVFQTLPIRIDESDFDQYDGIDDTDSVGFTDESSNEEAFKNRTKRKFNNQTSINETNSKNKNVSVQVNLIRAQSTEERRKSVHNIESRRSLNKGQKSPEFLSAKRCSNHTIGAQTSHDSSVYFDCFDFPKTPSPSKSKPNIHRSCINSKDIDRPMIHIIQEVTREKVVTSTIEINRKKVKQFSSNSNNNNNNNISNNNHNHCTIVRSKPVKRRKCRQKVDRENVQNEILAQTNDWNQISVDDGEHDSSETSVSYRHEFVETAQKFQFRTGKLEAHSKHSNNRPVGRLMAKRLERQVTLNKQQHQQYREKNKKKKEENCTKVPPIKPPRTFTSSKSNSDAGNSTTTVAIEDISFNNKTVISPAILPKEKETEVVRSAQPQKTAFQNLGWTFNVPTDIPLKRDIQPSCPTFDEINAIGYEHKKFGWIEPLELQKEEQTDEIFNMLNYEEKKLQMTSFNLMPQPQIKQCIDTVDSPPLRRTKTAGLSTSTNRSSSHLERPLIIKEEHPETEEDHSHKDNNSDHDYCKKCRLKIIKPKEHKSTFKKNALRRTKSFFRASKRKISTSKRILNPKSGLTDTEDCPPSPAKSTTTEQLNKTLEESAKKSVKYLGLTPLKLDISEDENTIDSPTGIDDKMQESIHETPPQKPIRKSRATDAANIVAKNTEENFDFHRKVHSPRQSDDQSKRRFMLSPKKLFKNLQNKSSPSKQTNGSYRSFAEQDDDFVIFMGEYLRHMMRKIEHPETELNVRDNDPKRISRSAANLNRIPTNLNESNDSDVEGIYSEISLQPTSAQSETPTRHIMVNNDPKAIYAMVNKSPRSVGSEPFEWKSLSSDESRMSLRLGNALSVSIENLLGNINNRQDDQSSINSTTKIEHCVLLHHPPPSIDGQSQVTNLTEGICDDVQHGDDINGEISTVIEQLERLDPALECREFKKAMPESDDSIIYLSSEETAGHDQVEGFVKNASVDELDRDILIDTVDFASKTLIAELEDQSQIFEATLKSSTPKQFKSPNLKSLKIKLRNSFNRSTNYFRTKDEQLSPQSSNTTTHTNQKQKYTKALMDQLNIYQLKLHSQIVYQGEIRNQLKKAIGLCRSSKVLESSAELVEAERLQLLAHRKENCARTQIDQISHGEPVDFIVNPDRCRGTISITNLEVPLKAETFYDTYFNYFYICVCSYRDQVVSTISRERKSNCVTFNNLENIVFSRLDPEFRILIEIYMLRLHKNTGFISGDNKSGTKEEKRSPLLTPVRAFANLTSPKIDTNKSKFRFQSSVVLTADHLQSNNYTENRRSKAYGENPFVVYYSSLVKNLGTTDGGDRSVVNGSISVGFDSEIVLINNPLLKTYLNLSDAKDHFWIRRWAVIDGCCMYFWGNQNEQQNLSPSFSIDLTKCCNESVELVDRKLCAMPMTFQIDITSKEINRGQRFTNDDVELKRYFIAADCNTDLINWLNELNRIIEYIRDWRI